jgi:ketosteroid isomerase-like protein
MENIMATATLPINEQTSKDNADILAVIEAAQNAVYRKDAEAFAAQYVRDAALFTLAPPLSHHGVDLQEKNAWFETWTGPIELEPRDFKVSVSGDIAFCCGFYRLSGVKKGVPDPISFWMRETVCLQRVGGAWKIVHEHTSVPFYMDATLRPAFDLKP